MKNVVILTGCGLRHRFVSKVIALADGVRVLRTYRESVAGTLTDMVARSGVSDSVQEQHLAARDRSEQDFFGAIVNGVPDLTHSVDIPRGEINAEWCAREIIDLAPDLVLAYGCSLIRPPLLEVFAGRILNAHLGLSPYYRGTGTNFWPLINGEPEYVGATFMYIDAGVDTGEIIHQMRARVFPGDTPHQIGNRLIGDVALAYAHVARCFDRLERMQQLPVPDNAHVYRKRDYSDAATAQLYRNFESGLVEKYLKEQAERDRRAPIIINPVLAGSCA